MLACTPYLPALETKTSRLGLLSRDAPRRSGFAGRRHVLLPALEAGRWRSRWDRFGFGEPSFPGLWSPSPPSVFLQPAILSDEDATFRTLFNLTPSYKSCLQGNSLVKDQSPSCIPVELGWTPNPGLPLQAAGSRLAQVCVRCPSCSVDHRAPRTCAPLLLHGRRLMGQQLPGEGSSPGDAEMHGGEPNHTNTPRLLFASHP